MRLERIVLRDFVIVRALDLDVGAGFTALTGETGAGKSILIDAVQLALGARGDAGFVREGAHQADICLEFSAPATGGGLHAWLTQAGFVLAQAPDADAANITPNATQNSTPDGTENHADSPPTLLRPTSPKVDLGRGQPPITIPVATPATPDAEPLLIRRTLDVHGRSRAWVNGAPATIAQLRELAAWLIDIHGQHAWQRLTQADAVRDLLDDWADALTASHPEDAAPSQHATRRAAAHHWAAWQAARREQAAATAAAERAAHERERLAWQLEEIERLAPQPDEWPTLNDRHQRLTHARELLHAASRTLDHLERDDRSAQTSLARATTLIEENLRHDAALTPIAHSLQAAQTHLDDACHSLHAWLRQARLDPQELDRIDERVSQWLTLARRWRCPPEDLPTLAQQWREQLAALDDIADVQTLAERQRQHRAQWQATAARLRERRQQAAPQLSQAITHAMQTLGMTGGRFEVQLLPAAASAHGADAVQLLVAGHPGAEPKPLAKVASGGELSRLALAIAVTTSALGQSGTLIFDEVDTGIGGAVAQTVGQLLRELGTNRQVLAVTHLPQVAASAHEHWKIQKIREKSNTYSTVQPLTDNERIDEIARMLSGQALSNTARAHAHALIAASQKS